MTYPSRFNLRRCARMLRGGAVLAYPTEAVYGLGCDPLASASVQRLLALKHRSAGKGLILVAARLSPLAGYLGPAPEHLVSRALSGWPGPVTWLWPASGLTPWWLSGDNSRIAVRVSAHPVVEDLCNSFGGALVSTSANHAGRPGARSALAVRARFGKALDGVLAGPLGGAVRPTEIRDLLSDRVLRAGGADA